MDSQEAATTSAQASTPATAQKDGYVDVGGGLRGARTDDELAQAVLHRTNNTVLVKYGTRWCQQCKALLPTFVDLTGKFRNTDYVIASIDTMKEAVKDIKYSPHFNVFCGGRKVDEFHGADAQRLRDRMWLHNERRASAQEGQLDGAEPRRRGGLFGFLWKQ